MATFHSYVKLPEGTVNIEVRLINGSAQLVNVVALQNLVGLSLNIGMILGRSSLS